MSPSRSRCPSRHVIGHVFVVCLALLAGYTPCRPDARAQEAAAAATTYAVFPRAIHLATTRDRQGIVVQATTPDGVTRDVTAEAVLTIDDPSRARLANGLLEIGRAHV